MKLAELPDQPRPGSNQPVATIDNIAWLLNQAGITPRYNEIKKRFEIEIPKHGGTSDNIDNVTMTSIVSLAASYGMATGHVPDYVCAIADRNAYNPVANWIRSKLWDGVDRLPDVYATVVAQADYPDALKQVLIRKWLLSAVAAAITPKGFHNRGVLTLQGKQGIGKTSWVKSLVSEPDLRDAVIKLDHHLDGGNKDSILGAICNWIVEIGELESSFRKDIARLKGFLTADSDRVRRPYARAESEYPRRTVFLATVNDSNFLTDTTGNTRWWTIAVERLVYDHSIDMQQVYAQLAVQFDSGAHWHLDADEEEMLEQWNRRHQAVSATADKIRDELDLTLIGKPGNPALTPTELLEKLSFKSPISNANAKECGAVLRELLGPPKRIHGRDRWHVPLKRTAMQPFRPMGQADEDDEF
jgi:predicted P-loop ATPase